MPKAEPGAAGDQPRQRPRDRAAPALREATSGGYTQPVLTQNAAQPPGGAIAARRAASEVALPAAVTAETAAMRGGAFIAPKPADAGLARPVPLTQPAIAGDGTAARSRAETQRPGAEPDRARHRCRQGSLGTAGAGAAADSPRRPARATATCPTRTGGSAGFEGRRSPRYSGFPAPPSKLTDKLETAAAGWAAGGMPWLGPAPILTSKRLTQAEFFPAALQQSATKSDLRGFAATASFSLDRGKMIEK